jgi:hypothetical protein
VGSVALGSFLKFGPRKTSKEIFPVPKNYGFYSFLFYYRNSGKYQARTPVGRYQKSQDFFSTG